MADFANIRNFKPAGPVAAAFLKDREHDVRALLGPVGGGKSVSCVFDCIRNASLMPPCNDGIIRYRIAIIGETYGQIERNLMPTWTTWLPGDGGDWTEAELKGGGGRSATHRIQWVTERDGKPHEVRFEAIFAAIGDNNVEQFMRGFEPTCFWLYEMDLLPEDVLDQALFRIGRYPATGDDGMRPDAMPPGVSFRSYVIGDLNAPDVDSWFFRRFEEDVPPGHKVYKQPSGRSPRAENTQNLPAGYYERQVSILSAKRNGKHLVRRMVDAQYGPTLDGEPCYPEYSDETHLAPQPLEPIPGVGLLLGFDAGLRRPACVIAQQDPKNGQYRLLAEVVPGRMGAHRFAEQVQWMIAEVAPGHKIAGAWGDPAGFDGADKEAGETAWMESVGLVLGVPIQPTETNELDPRLDAVSDELSYMIEPSVPGLMVSPRCKMIRKGFASHYRYKRERVGNTERTSDKPEKNDYSHPHDAVQYLLLGHKGRYGVIADRREGRKGRRADGRRSGPAGGSVRLQSNFSGILG